MQFISAPARSIDFSSLTNTIWPLMTMSLVWRLKRNERLCWQVHNYHAFNTQTCTCLINFSSYHYLTIITRRGARECACSCSFDSSNICWTVNDQSDVYLFVVSMWRSFPFSSVAAQTYLFIFIKNQRKKRQNSWLLDIFSMYTHLFIGVYISAKGHAYLGGTSVCMYIIYIYLTSTSELYARQGG